MLNDLILSLNVWRVWVLAPIYKIILQYRRTLLGTYWLTITMLAVVALKAMLFSDVLNVEPSRLVPSLAMGMTFWALISFLITGGANAFIASRQVLSDGNYSLVVPVLSNIVSGFFIFIHTFFVMIVFSSFYVEISIIGCVITLLGLVIIALGAIGLGTTLAYICARFRDFERFIRSLMAVMFIVTPVIWLPELVSSNHAILLFNPLYHVLEVVRDPIIGQPIVLMNWYVTIGLSIFFFITAVVIRKVWAKQIVLWL